MANRGSGSYSNSYLGWRKTNNKYASIQHWVRRQLFSINMNKKVLNRLADGPSSEFQKKVSSRAVILLFVLMVLLGGPFFATENWRLIWLGALMATAMHFFPYYYVHGKSMIYLGLACAINVFAGYIFTNIPLEVIAYIDAAIKLVFGIYLLFLSKPSKQI
nr:DUF6609 family protein [Rothia mucilaginosa]